MNQEQVLFKEFKMLKCPVCQSEKWENGSCGKCGYKNDNPFGRVNTGLGKKQQVIAFISQKRGFATIEDIMAVYKKRM